MPGPPGDVRVAFLTHPTVRNTDPNIDDWGVVSRVITSIAGPLLVQEIRPTIAVKTTVTAPADTSQILIAAANLDSGAPLFSGGRRGLYIFNNSQTRFLYLLLFTPPGPPAPPVSQSKFTLRVPPQSGYVMPYPMFTNEVWGAWFAAGVEVAPFGNAQVTELTG